MRVIQLPQGAALGAVDVALDPRRVQGQGVASAAAQPGRHQPDFLSETHPTIRYEACQLNGSPPHPCSRERLPGGIPRALLMRGIEEAKSRHMRRLLTCLLLLGAQGCYAPGDGPEPPLDRIYFPVGVAVTPDRSQLLVANSDFDLQFNAGSFQVIDLPALRKVAVETSADPDCGGLGEKSPADLHLAPGRCRPINPSRPPSGSSLLQQSIGIGAFATDVLVREQWDDGDDPTTAEREFVGCTASMDDPQGNCSSGECRPWLETQAGADMGATYTGYCATRQGLRVFIPVRGDATLHYLDAVGSEYDCGQSGNGGACDDNHRRGDEPDAENTRDLRMPPEPYGVAATPDAEAIVVTHQSSGRASLFVNSWEQGPRLEFVVDGMPSGAVGAVNNPEPLGSRLFASAKPSFLVSFRNSATIELLRYYDDVESNEPRPFLTRSGSASVAANSLGFDSRGLGVDATSREACEAECLATATDTSSQAIAAQSDCLEACRDDVPLDVYVANRTPASLLRGRTRDNGSELPQFFDSLVLSTGPSRVISGEVLARCNPTQASDDPCRRKENRLFVICFDSRKVYVVEPKTGRVESVFQTGRGPHAFATDVALSTSEQHAFGYLAHFTDSYIGVIDLDQASPTYGTFLATVGTPTAPRASK